MGLTLHVDGGSRGNPGPAGAGVVIRDDQAGLVHEAGYFLGTQTNNAAEYHALIRGLQRVARCQPTPLTVISDSELLVRQITGAYQVKNARLATLFQEAQRLLLKIKCWSMQHVRRENNRRADELANLAMDEGRDVVVFDVDQANDGAATAESAGTIPASKQRERDVQTGESSPEKAPAPARSVARATDSVAARGQTRAIRVALASAPSAGECPAGGFRGDGFTVEHALPEGLCVHAAHAILPTLLAMQNTDRDEFAAIPTLTVRCSRNGCGAKFLLSPLGGANGAAKR
ncbi:MAG: reverse transcriptase-like protein [Phycisphaerae bacterium]